MMSDVPLGVIQVADLRHLGYAGGRCKGGTGNFRQQNFQRGGPIGRKPANKGTLMIISIPTTRDLYSTTL